MENHDTRPRRAPRTKTMLRSDKRREKRDSQVRSAADVVFGLLCRMVTRRETRLAHINVREARRHPKESTSFRRLDQTSKCRRGTPSR